jgi:hypothetical protein
MRIFVSLLAFFVVGYVVLCLMLFFRQRAMIYFPTQRAGGTAVPTMLLDVDGVRLRVSVRPLEVPEAIVYFGGNAEDVSLTLGELAEIFPQRAIYAMHYRSYGGSGGSPSESAFFADGFALFDRVAQQHRRITVIGRSLGSGVAVRIASARPASRLVLVTPYDSLADVAVAALPYLPVRLMLKDRFDSFRYAPLVKAPTTIVEAAEDEVIPKSSTQLLATRFAPGLVTYQVIDHVGHNTVSMSPKYPQLLRGAPQD